MVTALKEAFKTSDRTFFVIAVIYFFFNCLFLPEGLQVTTFLTPLFLWWTLKDNIIKPYIWFFVITIPYAIIHLWNGVELHFYLRSWALAFCAITFATAVYNFLKKKPDPKQMLKEILIINMALIPVAGIALLMPGINKYFWYYKEITPGAQSFPRLSILTYEASYYALRFAPVFLFFTVQLLQRKNELPAWFILLAAMIPVGLAMSFGVIGALAISILAAFALQFAHIFNTNKKILLAVFPLAALFLMLFSFLFFLPHNAISIRIANLLSNKDTSFNGRTYQAFYLAGWIASLKSNLFGVGFGQIKVLGHDIIINYYKYYDPHPVVRIPNTLAETLAMFGITGLIIRFFLEGYFFIQTRVISNVYRFAIFVFVFVYQFTGSFMFNIVELTLWVIAFSPTAFPEFNRSNLSSTDKT
jgi:hypothetical protein